MSNFFGALDSDDEAPAPKIVKPSAGKPAAGEGHSATRVTGAAKKNKDQQRHGATPRNGKEGEKPDVKKGDKRQFDRRSGTGKSGAQKKDGRGAHSFGSASQDAEQAMKDPKSADVEIDGAVEDDEAEEVEPEAPTMTMDEFLAQKKTLGNLLGPKKIREVSSSGLTTIAKAAAVDLLAPTAEKAPSNFKGFSKTMQANASQKVEIKFGFAEAPRFDREDRDSGDRRPRRDGEGGGSGRGAGGRGDRGDRGGRGGERDNKGRGGGGRGGSRGAAVNLENTKDFPRL